MPYRLSRRVLNETVAAPGGSYDLLEQRRQVSWKGYVAPVLVEVVNKETSASARAIVTLDAQVCLLEAKDGFRLPLSWKETDKQAVTDAIVKHYTHDVLLVPDSTYDSRVVAFRYIILQEAFRMYGCNQSRAAQALGMSRSGFQYQWECYGLKKKVKSKRKPIEILLAPYDEMVREFERSLLKEAYAEMNGDWEEVGKRLNIKRTTLSDRLRRLGMAS